MFTHHICRLLGAVELAGMRKRGPDTTQPILVGIDGAALRPTPAALGLPKVCGLSDRSPLGGEPSRHAGRQET